MELFAERLKALRTEKGLSLMQIEKETGISKSAISFWERGERMPTAEHVIILAKFLNVSADYLLGLEN